MGLTFGKIRHHIFVQYHVFDDVQQIFNISYTYPLTQAYQMKTPHSERSEKEIPLACSKIIMLYKK